MTFIKQVAFVNPFFVLTQIKALEHTGQLSKDHRLGFWYNIIIMLLIYELFLLSCLNFKILIPTPFIIVSLISSQCWFIQSQLLLKFLVITFCVYSIEFQINLKLSQEHCPTRNADGIWAERKLSGLFRTKYRQRSFRTFYVERITAYLELITNEE